MLPHPPTLLPDTRGPGQCSSFRRIPVLCMKVTVLLLVFVTVCRTSLKLKVICMCAPSSDLPGLKTGLPHLLTTSLAQTSDQVGRWCRPNFRPAPTSDHQISFVAISLFQKFKCKHKFYSFKIIFLLLKSQIIQILPHTKTHKFTSNIGNLLHVFLILVVA